MLDEYKKIFQDNADNISEWKSLTKDTLCNLYIDCVEQGQTQQANYYLSAIICKYWSTMEKYIVGSSGFNSPEDTYDWVIQTILDTLDKKVWRLPNHKLYNNPKGPTIAINQTLKSNKMLMFKAENRQKREINHKADSIESLQDSLQDIKFPNVVDYYGCMNDIIKRVVKEKFIRKNYFCAILIDLIVNFNCFKTYYENEKKFCEFSHRNVVYYFSHINDAYLKRFSLLYNIPIDEVISCKKYLSVSNQEIYAKIPNCMQEIKKELYIGKEDFFYVN